MLLSHVPKFLLNNHRICWHGPKFGEQLQTPFSFEVPDRDNTTGNNIISVQLQYVGGRMSDKHIVEESTLMNYLLPRRFQSFLSD